MQKKKILKIAGIIVLVIVLVGYLGYNRYFKPDPEIQQQLNNQFGEEFFTSFDDPKVINNSGAVDDIKSVNNLKEKIDLPLAGFRGKVKEPVESNGETIPTPEDKTAAPKRLTQDEVESKYRPQFNYLQSTALSRLDTLYSAAIQEYMQSKKAGTVNRSALVQKYYQAGTKLEASMDSQFYGTLNALQEELMANNLATNIVDQYKSEYEKAKSNKRSQLLAKVLK